METVRCSGPKSIFLKPVARSFSFVRGMLSEGWSGFSRALSLLWLEVSPFCPGQRQQVPCRRQKGSLEGSLTGGLFPLHRIETFVYYNSSKLVISVQGKNHFCQFYCVTVECFTSPIGHYSGGGVQKFKFSNKSWCWSLPWDCLLGGPLMFYKYIQKKPRGAQLPYSEVRLHLLYLEGNWHSHSPVGLLGED